MNEKNKGKILFDESSNSVLQAKRVRSRRVILLWGIFCTFVLLFFIWIIIFKFSSNYVSILLYSMGITVALVMVIASIMGFFSITFIKVYENGIALPEKKFHNLFHDEEFIPYSKIKMIKIEQRMLIVKKLIIEGYSRRPIYFGDLRSNVIDTDRFIQVLYKLQDEGKIKFMETEDKPFYYKSIDKKV